jgi:hypothetical protein
MKSLAFRRALVVWLALFALLGPAFRASAQTTGVTFTLTLKSAFARTVPGGGGYRAASLFKGQTYPVLAKSADGLWFRIDYPGARTEAWVAKNYGTFTGNLEGLPVSAGGGGGNVVVTPNATTVAAGPPLPTVAPAPSGAVYYPTDMPVIPSVSQTARDLYQRGLQQGTNPKRLSRIGDCQSVVPYFLASFDYGTYALGPYAHLQPTIDNFLGSWARQGIASNRGFNVATVFVPVWADPRKCLKSETPLACELRLNRPSLVIISMETWWGGEASGYESYMRQILNTVIASGAVPILGTKADNIEGTGSVNAAVVRLAREYDLPLWNFWLAAQPLPNHGLHSDGFHLTWERNTFDNPATLEKSWPMRNLTALQAIDAVWRAVSAP